MVVLESVGMLSAANNQYLQPDYLSPLPITLDAKKSPLALLAQTCSQIGSDTPTSKHIISPLEKSKKATESIRSSPKAAKEKCEHTRSTSIDNTPAFKPYENTIVSNNTDENRPSSKCSEHNYREEKKEESRSPGRNTNSPTDSSTTPNLDMEHASGQKCSTPSAREASPIIRSGIEILQGHSKETALGTYKPTVISSGIPSASLNGHLSSLCCQPGLEHTNPAFRSSFPGAQFNPAQHAHMFTSGYPGTSAVPYLSYARVKTPSGGEALLPVCKDPYCSGCQFSIQNQQLSLSGAPNTCPSGCSQCDHQKYNLAMAMSLVPSGPIPTSLAYTHLGRPYVCNWIASDTYCGKRFVTSEELLQHLRTHTSVNDTSTVVTSATSLLNSHPLFSTPSLQRAGYPNPPLSPLSSARYHPYGKPSLATSLAASPYSAFNPTALGHYYSAYSVYGQRLGAAVVHP